jgi:phosphatidate cytidylyltransferase
LGRQPRRHPYLWQGAGFSYTLLPPGCAVLYILQTDPLWLAWSAGMTICADVAAYFCGRAIGGAKLCPAISPGKTWAGSVGAVIACSLLALLPWGPTELTGKLGAAGLLVIVATAGDFYESHLKRQAGVKDSGSLLPGHGGLFDRVDGHIAAIPLTAALLWWLG